MNLIQITSLVDSEIQEEVNKHKIILSLTLDSNKIKSECKINKFVKVKKLINDD